MNMESFQSNENLHLSLTTLLTLPSTILPQQILRLKHILHILVVVPLILLLITAMLPRIAIQTPIPPHILNTITITRTRLPFLLEILRVGVC